MLYDGESVSLKPSIGNWSYDCQSHYWITKDEIRWSTSWTKEEIDSVRKHEISERQSYFENKKPVEEELENVPIAQEKFDKNRSWLSRLFFWK
ncbi:MAG: DUF6527 family protein [Flavobacteriaceae bacterium]